MTIADSVEIRLKGQICRASPDHFRPVATDADKRALFKESVKHVILEQSSYCNRRCGFCPNVGLTRIKEENLLPKALFEKIVGELAEIEFGGVVLFHLYNEPLAASDVLIERMAWARSRLPDCMFGFNTNGDYLTRPILDRLNEAGCDQIFVSVYGPRHGEWDDAYVRNRVLKIAKTLGVDDPLVETPGLRYQITTQVGRIRLFIAARNLWISGYDRGGLVPELARTRTSPCTSPISDFLVDHRGWVLPCCNVYTDEPEHLKHTIGRLEDQTIFDAYASATAQAWRNGLLRYSPGGELCESCTRNDHPGSGTPQSRADLDAVRVSLGLDAAEPAGPRPDPSAS